MVWPAVDYVTQYLDEELMTTISDCTNALSISRSGKSIASSTEKIFRFFGASMFMTCVPYPQMLMYWAHDSRLPAIANMMSRKRFFNLRSSLKTVTSDDVTKENKADDVFWKV